MKTKVSGPAEDPETKAKRLASEARAEADGVAAMRSVLDKRTRRITRIFGHRLNIVSPRMSLFAATAGAAGGSGGAGATGGGGSGSSGVVAFSPKGFQPRTATGSDKQYLRNYRVLT